MPELRLIRADPHRLLDASTAALAGWREDDHLSPVAVAAPSRTVARLLVRESAREAGIAVNVLGLTLHDLAREMALPATEGFPLPKHADRLLVAERLESDPGPLGAAARRPAVAAAVARAVRDLRLLGTEFDAADIAAELHPREVEVLRHVQRIATAVAERMEASGLLDDAALYGAALARLLPLGAERLLLHAIYDLDGVQRRLVEAIARRAQVTWVIPEPDETWSAAPIVRDTIDWAEGRGFVSYAYRHAEGDEAATPRILASPGLAAEAQEIARELLAAAERGRSFGEMAVIVASSERQEPLLAAELRRAGIPVAASGSSALVDAPDGRILLAVLRLIEGDASESEVAAIVGHLAEARPEIETTAARAESLARQAGCAAADPSAWPSRLDRLADQLERRAAARLAAAEPEEDEEEGTFARGHDELREDARRARAIGEAAREGLARLAAVRRTVESSDARRAWSTLAAELEAAVEILGIAGDVATAAREAACGLLVYEVRGLPLRFEHALEIFGERLGAASPRAVAPDVPADEPDEREEDEPPPGEARFDRSCGSRRPGEGVLLTDVNRARGLRLPLVWCAGLSQDLFGGPSAPDPVLGDAVRGKIAGLTGLPLGTSTRRAEEADLLLALAAASGADAATLSWPRIDDATGQVRYPADPLARLIEARSGVPLPPDDPASAEGVVRVPRDPPAIGASERALLDAHEYDLAAVATGDPRQRGHLDREPRLVRGRAVHEARFMTRELTAHDGLTGPDGALGSRFSPSSLERLARCPFKAFLHDRLRLGAGPDESVPVDPQPVDVGRLAHRVLESLMQPLAGTPHGQWPDAASLCGRVAPLVERHLRGLLAEGVPGLLRVWEAVAERLRAEIARTLLDELDLLERGRHDVLSLETPLEHDVEIVGARVTLRGRPDRVDRRPDGGLVVTDYKHAKGDGYPDGKKKVFDGGRWLQLPVYARLAGLALPAPAGAGPPSVRFVFLRADATRPSIEAQLTEEDRGERLDALVTELIGEAKSGGYFQVPSRANCAYCDFAGLCGPGKERIGRIKKDDERRRRHAGLAERYP